MPEVRRAAELIEAGEITDRQTWLMEPTAEVMESVGQHGMRAAQDRLVEVSVLRRGREDDARALVEALERATREAARESASRAQAERERDELRQREGALMNRVSAAEEATRSAQAAARAARTLAADLEERAARAEDAARSAEGAADDARLRQAEATQQADALALLTRQYQHELETLRAELARAQGGVAVLAAQRDELLASRWRRYGQKIGVVMTMPWEAELRNGKA